MEVKYTLSDLFYNWRITGNGIFYFITDINVPGRTAPWKNIIPGEVIDRFYYGQRSGDKYASKFLTGYLDSGETYLSGKAKQELANDLLYRFLPRWNHLWATYYSVDYNPLNPYDVTTSRAVARAGQQAENDTSQTATEESITHGLTTTVTHGKTGQTSTQETTTHGLTNTITHGKTVQSESDRYGFDSQNPSPADESSTTEGGTTVSANSGTDSKSMNFSSAEGGSTVTGDSGVDSTTKNFSSSGNKAASKNETENETVHKSGNVGTYAPQELMQKERALWNWDFFNEVFKDLDSVLTKKVFITYYG